MLRSLRGTILLLSAVSLFNAEEQCSFVPVRSGCSADGGVLIRELDLSECVTTTSTTMSFTSTSSVTSTLSSSSVTGTTSTQSSTSRSETSTSSTTETETTSTGTTTSETVTTGTSTSNTATTLTATTTTQTTTSETATSQTRTVPTTTTTTETGTTMTLTSATTTSATMTTSTATSVTATSLTATITSATATVTDTRTSTTVTSVTGTATTATVTSTATSTVTSTSTVPTVTSTTASLTSTAVSTSATSSTTGTRTSSTDTATSRTATTSTTITATSVTATETTVTTTSQTTTSLTTTSQTRTSLTATTSTQTSHTTSATTLTSTSGTSSTVSSMTSTSSSHTSSTTESNTTTSATTTSTRVSHTSTSTGPAPWCRHFWGGVPVGPSSCSKAGDEDWCLAPTETFYRPGCGEGRSEGRLVCPVASSVNASVEASCTTCATVYAQDWGSAGYHVSGTIRWSPRASCLEESVIDGYHVWLVDECGNQLELVGTVLKSQQAWEDEMMACCHDSWYSLHLPLTAAPSTLAAVAIVPYKGSQEFSLSLLPILQTTVVTTTTTTMADPSPVGIEGCLGLSMDDTSAFVDPDNSAAIEQAFRGFIAAAAGESVLPDYVQDIRVAIGAGCGAAPDARRLQQLLTVTYVILLPPTLADRASVALAAAAQLSAFPLEQATLLLNEEMQKYPALAGVTVEVLSSQHSVVGVVQPWRPDGGLDVFMIIAIVVSVVCVLLLCGILLYRRFQGPSSRAAAPPDPILPVQEPAETKGRTADPFDVQVMFAENKGDVGEDLEFQLGTGDHEVMPEREDTHGPDGGGMRMPQSDACTEAKPLQLITSGPPPSSGLFGCCACDSRPAQGQMASCEAFRCSSPA